MPRVKRGFKARRRRNRIRQEARGFRGGRSKLWKAMVDAVHHAWRYATWHRRERKRDFRRLWIVRINAAARGAGVSYSRLIGGMKRHNIEIDRKILAELAISDPAAFQKIVQAATAA
jgi:large subunit ribosomal protein L20